MCGIVGYVGNRNVKDVLIAGLKKLEYRGYDSSGIAALTDSDVLFCVKAVGKIQVLEDKLNSSNIGFKNIGIAHTRWATHGSPAENNAHPHTSKNVTLVHNGIIENYLELKEFLTSRGVRFYSETDTEVATKYISYLYDKNYEEHSLRGETLKLRTLQEVTEKLNGSYAFAIIFNDDVNTIYAVRKDSPLIIGVADGENFIGSDPSAFVEFTNKYISLELGEIGVITKDNIQIFNENLNLIEKEVNVSETEAVNYTTNGYDSYMQKEMFEQPKVVSNIFSRFSKANNLAENIDFKRFNKIHIVACGSAMHAGLVGQKFFENIADLETEVFIASEYRYKKLFIDENTLVIIISQSGETADTLAALKTAREHNAYTLAIVNVVDSSISREADLVIYTMAGPEIAVATTKGYTSQVAVLLNIALSVAGKTADVDFESFSSKLNYILGNNKFFQEIAEKIYKQEHLFYIGRGVDYALCMEASLKLKEISYLHSEAYAAGELKHGTISLIEDNTPVIAIITDENLCPKTISNIKETKARGAYTIVITTCNISNSEEFCDKLIKLPHLEYGLDVFEVILVAQQIAYNVAKLRNTDIDKPKNLAKSVTVE